MTGARGGGRRGDGGVGRGRAAVGQDAAAEADRRWMQRALTLAARGRGRTRPNPMVGAVVVRGGRVLGEGFHRRPGSPHAEINALAALANKGRGAAGATLYVTLEPCCHTGRTAPCTTALLAAGLARVVVGVRDPNPLVNGRGIALLRRGGVRVDVGCLEEECRELNRPFFTWITEGRPLVTLKAAASLDGFIADGERRETATPVWITGPAARAAGHLLRSKHDAILVGAGTVLADNPRLTVRLGAIPRGAGAGDRVAPFLRVILDGKLRIPPSAVVLAPAPGARTLVVGAAGAPGRRAAALRKAGALVELLPARNGRVALEALLAVLAERYLVQALLVEGGAAVHGAFIASGLVDRVAFFFAPVLLGDGIPIARGQGGGVVAARVPHRKKVSLGPLSVRAIGGDLLVEADVRR